MKKSLLERFKPGICGISFDGDMDKLRGPIEGVDCAEVSEYVPPSESVR